MSHGSSRDWARVPHVGKHSRATSDQHVARLVMWHGHTVPHGTTMPRVDHWPIVPVKWHGQPVPGGTIVPPCSTCAT